MNASPSRTAARSSFSADMLVRFVQDALRQKADPSKAPQMAAYMKTDMPFYGVQKPDREPILRAMHVRFIPTSHDAYTEGVHALWRLRHREEKYTAIEFAGRHKKFITPQSLPLYEKLIREGAFLSSRPAIVQFLQRKWVKELDYRLIKELWACQDNRIAVRFAYEWHDDAGNWFRAYGNENWEFDEHGLMRRRIASINDLPISEAERKYHWLQGRRPDDHPGWTELGL